MPTKVSRRASGGSLRTSSSAQTVSLSDQLKKMGRHPIVLILAILLGALLGAVGSIIAPPKYAATATVLATPLATNPNAAASNQLVLKIDTEASVASSREVAEDAANKIDSQDEKLSSRLLDSVEVSPHSGTEVMDIKATAQSPEDAALYANSIAESYLDVRSATAQKRKDALAAEAQAHLDSLGENASPEIRTSFEEKLAQIKLTNTDSGRVIAIAQEPQEAENFGLAKSIFIGAVIGFLFGAILAWVVDNRLRKLSYKKRADEVAGVDLLEVRDSSDVEDTRRVLMALGMPGGNFRATESRGIVVYSPTAKIAQEFADLLDIAITQNKVRFSESISSILSPDFSFASLKTQPLIAIAEPETGFSEVLSAAELVGSGIIVVDSSTKTSQLREFAELEQNTSNADILYVYMDIKEPSGL